MEAQLMEYVTEAMLIVIPVLWILGVFLKKIPNFPDWAIVWTLLVAGIVIALFVVGFTVDGLIQGVIVAGVAVFAHQLYKQTAKQIN